MDGAAHYEILVRIGEHFVEHRDGFEADVRDLSREEFTGYFRDIFGWEPIRVVKKGTVTQHPGTSTSDVRLAGQYTVGLLVACYCLFPVPLHGQSSELASDESDRVDRNISLELERVEISGEYLGERGADVFGAERFELTFSYLLHVESGDEPRSVSVDLESVFPDEYYLNGRRLPVTRVSDPMVLPAEGWGDGSTDKGAVLEAPAGKHRLRITTEMAANYIWFSPSRYID